MLILQVNRVKALRAFIPFKSFLKNKERKCVLMGQETLDRIHRSEKNKIQEVE